MTVPAGKVPIQKSIIAALDGWRTDLPGLLPYALGTGVFAAALSFAMMPLLTGQNPLTALGFQALLALGASLFFARAMAPGLGRAGATFNQIVANALSVYGAILIVGFFMTLVIGVAMMPGVAVLGLVMVPYQAQLEAAGSDFSAQLPILQEVAKANPEVMIGLALVYGFIWLALTSRFYLAAPASAEANRPLSFETWRLTQGNMLRIMAARLGLLIPAFMLMVVLSTALVSLLGVPQTELGQAVPMPNPLVYAAAQGISMFVSSLFYSALEARLSAFLYQGLKPAP
jgi:hypothetical protein